MTQRSRHRTRRILLVEDSAADATIARRALAKGPVPVKVYHVTDGDAALAFLRGEWKGERAPPPDLVLLDLNLPGRDGREVLAEIRAEPGLRTLPVLVLSSSTAEEDVRASYEAQANGFISKPFGFHEFVRLVEQIEEFWFKAARLPEPLPAVADGGAT